MVEVHVGEQVEYGIHRGDRLQAGQMQAQANVRSLHESQLQSGVVPAHVITVGLEEHLRVAVGAGQRNRH